MNRAHCAPGQQDRRMADILGLAPAPGGNSVAGRAAALGIGTQGRGAACIDRAGRDGHYGDSTRGQFIGQQPTHPGNAMPGRGAGRNTEITLKMRDTDASSGAMRVHLARISEIFDQIRLRNRALFSEEG